MTICRYSLNVLRLQFNLGTRKIISFLAGNKSGDNQGLDPSPEVTTFQWSIVIQLKLSNF